MADKSKKTPKKMPKQMPHQQQHQRKEQDSNADMQGMTREEMMRDGSDDRRSRRPGHN
ncbi:hypothetical protein [Nocardia camponoti]|uniref:Uncharacterized protein n=1 Tax=Nocardia camponoti TaxID=1616106 RepID=A0A917QDN2_9NOCA|nr:hypothetical protein [Nocardia camponoti]GGK45383.1 hypothetical protein GCM10011591_16240 [Nocardia camponoti]